MEIKATPESMKYGYCLKDGRVIRNPKEAALVVMAFTLSLKMGCRKNAQELARLGFRTRDGKGPCQRWINELLNRPYHLYVPPIIDQKLYGASREAAAKRAERFPFKKTSLGDCVTRSLKPKPNDQMTQSRNDGSTMTEFQVLRRQIIELVAENRKLKSENARLKKGILEEEEDFNGALSEERQRYVGWK